jgi:hypothetical protein
MHNTGECCSIMVAVFINNAETVYSTPGDPDRVPSAAASFISVVGSARGIAVCPTVTVRVSCMIDTTKGSFASDCLKKVTHGEVLTQGRISDVAREANGCYLSGKYRNSSQR